MRNPPSQTIVGAGWAYLSSSYDKGIVDCVKPETAVVKTSTISSDDDTCSCPLYYGPAGWV
eukprot:scaffold331814_cov36-Prasinocladus_malaysianus.AAC.1